jgi:hypothetical protein
MRANARQNYQENIEGLMYHTGFSGMDCASMALHQSVIGWRSHHGAALNIVMGPSQYHAGDKNANCRRACLSHKKRARHVFGANDETLTEHGRKEVAAAWELNQIDIRMNFGDIDVSDGHDETEPKHKLESSKIDQVGERCLDRFMRAVAQPGVFAREIKCYVCAFAGSNLVLFIYGSFHMLLFVLLL